MPSPAARMQDHIRTIVRPIGCGREFDLTTMRYMHIHQGAELPDISACAPFKAVIVADYRVSPQRRDEISAWLVEMGCRYVMSYGENCESWTDSVRRANLEAFDLDDMSARDFVMTTSHTTEPIRWVIWYAKKMANHPENAFKELVMLHLADRERSGEFQVMYQKA